MVCPARYLADFARSVATKGTQERHDGEAPRALEVIRRRPAGPITALIDRYFGDPPRVVAVWLVTRSSILPMLGTAR